MLSFELKGVKSQGFLGLDKLQITLTKEKEGRLRKSKEEERRKRGKAIVALLLFIMVSLKTVGHRKVHLAITFSKIRLDIHFCFSKSPMCSCLERFGVRDVKETFF